MEIECAFAHESLRRGNARPRTFCKVFLRRSSLRIQLELLEAPAQNYLVLARLTGIRPRAT